MRNTKELYVASRNDWRAWLEKNHGTVKEVWLIFYKTHTEKPSIPYDDAVEEALCFGWVDSIIKRIDDDKFARKFTPRKVKSKWSELNKKRAEKMIKEGKMTKSGLRLIIEAKKNGEWCKKAAPRRTLAIPAFMQEALEANKKALENFSKLASSYKRQYIGWIASAKREETRKRRLAEAIEHLERNEKLGMK